MADAEADEDALRLDARTHVARLAQRVQLRLQRPPTALDKAPARSAWAVSHRILALKGDH
jgi:hypothetical protein